MGAPATEDQKRVWADIICEKVAEGATLQEIAQEMGCTVGNVLYRVTYSAESTEKYARARDAAADIFESKIIEAAESVDPKNANAHRVKIDALKWVAARRCSKKYGDRVTAEISGPDGGPIQTVDPTKVPDDALRAILAARVDPDKR